MSETLATYGAPCAAPSAAKEGRRPLVTTIHWTPLDEGLPAYGHTVAVWIGLLDIVVHAYRDARVSGIWRLAGTDGPPLDETLVSAWAELPNGPLPPPDGGGA